MRKFQIYSYVTIPSTIFAYQGNKFTHCVNICHVKIYILGTLFDKKDVIL